jgi:hypothetical protein
VKIITPLTNLLKKSSETYEWDETCNEAFETLKGILVKAPMLKLPNFDKDFEIHSDASNFAIGIVLMQDGRPVAFESKKLNKMERRCLNIMASPRTLCRIKTQSSQASFGQPYGNAWG